VATHQALGLRPKKSVLTWYWPLDYRPPEVARKEALARDAETWKKLVSDELARLHPELAGAIRRIDVRVWGHAMIRPSPGFIWGEERRRALHQYPPIFFAHSDMAGISIFEEAYGYGVQAAQAATRFLRVQS